MLCGTFYVKWCNFLFIYPHKTISRYTYISFSILCCLAAQCVYLFQIKRNFHLEFCMLYKRLGTILSMWTLSQIFSAKSSETVFRTTPCSPFIPANRIESRISMLSSLWWHMEANFDTKKSYLRWYDGVSSSIFANLTNWKSKQKENWIRYYDFW